MKALSFKACNSIKKGGTLRRRRRIGGRRKPPEPDVRINDMIKAKEVRLIDSEGNQLGVTNIDEALRIASEQKLDLVEVAPQADPPVCRIMNYGKYKFQKSKRDQAAKKRQKTFQVKEVKFRPKTEEHDYQFKLKHVQRFLKSGNKVKATIMFRGREMAYTDFGRQILQRVTEEVEELGQVESPPKLEGRNMSMILAPK